MKLPTYEPQARLDLRMRTAAQQRDPAPMQVRAERFIPEVTSDDVTRAAVTRVNARQQAFGAVSSSLRAIYDKQQRVKAQIEEVEAQNNAAAAYQGYMQHMLGWTATRMMSGSTVERSDAPNTALGFTEERQWETLQEEYAEESNRIFGELKNTYLGSPAAQKYFGSKRATLDKQTLDKIYKHQYDQKINLAQARVFEANALDTSVVSVRERSEAAVRAGLDAEKVMKDMDVNIKRINLADLQTRFNEFQVRAALTNDDWDQYDDQAAARIWAQTEADMAKVLNAENPLEQYASEKEARANGVQFVESLRKLPDDAYDKLWKQYQVTLKYLDERDKRHSQIQYNKVLQQTAVLDGEAERDYLQTTLTAAGARDVFGEYYDDLITLRNAATEKNESNAEIVGLLDRAITDIAGNDSSTDRQIMGMLTHWRATSLSKEDYTRLVGRLDSKRKDRRTRQFTLADELLEMALVGPNPGGSMEAYLNDEYGAQARGRYIAAKNKLERWRMNNPDGDLVNYAESLILDSVRIEPWMQDYEGKSVKGRSRIMDINPDMSESALDAEITKRLSEGTISATGDVWETSAREKLRRIRAIQSLMIEVQTNDPNAPDVSTYFDTWVSHNAPELMYE